MRLSNYQDSYFAQGLRLLDLGDCQAAAAQFDKALKLGLGDMAQVYVYRAEALACLGDFRAAHQSIESALQLRPYMASAYTTRGDIRRAQSQIEQAIADYTTAIHIEPDDAEAYFNRALAYEWRRQFGDAEADLTRVLELDAAFGAAHEIRGRLRARRFNYPGAIADIRAYLKSETGQSAENRSEMQGYLVVLRTQWLLWRLLSRLRRKRL